MLFGLFLTFLTSIQGDELMVKVNKLTSTKTQLPYSYYSLPFCKPDKIVDSTENLGEVLRGDRIENSPYVVSLFNYYLIKILHSFGFSFGGSNSYRSYTCLFGFLDLSFNFFWVCVVQNEATTDVHCCMSCCAKCKNGQRIPGEN